jgi:methylated-DNA-protein-cysteine methyltransferase related protein
MRILRESAASKKEKSMASWDPVYRLVKKIPRGRVTTYGALAKALRLRGGARAAGYAMAACPSGKGIPWHRVIGAGGRLLIQEPHSSLQRRLLETEGVILDGKRVNMKTFAWMPVKTRKNSTGRFQTPKRRRTTRRRGL